MAREIWIGVVRVRAVPGRDPLAGAKGATVNAMAYVESADEFKRLVAKELREINLLAERIDGLDLLENKIDETEPTAELFNVIEELTEHGGVRFDEFEPFE
jgi:hypothetical protein